MEVVCVSIRRSWIKNVCVCQEAPGCPVIAHLGAVGDKESEMQFSVRHTAVIMNLISVPKFTGEHDLENMIHLTVGGLEEA